MKIKAIRVGDEFDSGFEVWKVIETKPGGRVTLFEKRKCRFIETYKRQLREWRWKRKGEE